MRVVITKTGKGKCLLRGVEAEGVEADFGGGLRGFFSKAEFWRLLKTRNGSGEEQPLFDKSRTAAVSDVD